MSQPANDPFPDEHQDALRSIRMSRVILPILLGVAAVAYLLWRKFDPAEFAKINWTGHTFFWIGMSVLLLIVRHLAYASRLYLLAKGSFSWLKCIELIFIWEFSSAVSPTSIGGSAVAFFVLAQEKLSTARTATIVLYTIVLDSLFFLTNLPLLFLFFGANMIRPGLTGWQDLGGWGQYFVFSYLLMFAYSSVFYYGLFINPRQLKRLLTGVTRIRFLQRFQARAAQLGEEMIVASGELKKQTWYFHLAAFTATGVAWSCRFLLLNCLIIAFVTGIATDFWNQFALYARLETMFVIILFSPTPGGAGFVEVLFGGFLTDYVSNKTLATVISTIWRLLAYYSYLFAGVIIVPNWIRKRVNERRLRKAGEQT
ncbi:MAG: flippase-like domain-containing protein [Lewinellaceae bacterium]|nr:flippase-like domain-containing protein [Lewinellaceae bacterium]